MRNNFGIQHNLVDIENYIYQIDNDEYYKRFILGDSYENHKKIII